MGTAASRGRMRLPGPLGLVLGLALATAAPAVGINLTLTDRDLARAAGIARWPTTEAERARFHGRYTFAVNGKADPVAVQRLEVITEFRRVVLIAEEHARLNDLFGRGGVADVRAAVRPFAGRVAVAAHLQFALASVFVGVPPVEIVLGGPGGAPLEIRSTPIYADQTREGGGNLIGAAIEATFDAASVGDTTREAIVRWNASELARVAVNFADLE